MFIDPTFKFPLSISRQSFENKPSKSGQISKIVFVPCPQTIDSVLQFALKGHAFCYDFFPDQGGRITIRNKTIPNFRSTSTLFFDFDKMAIQMYDYIEELPYKPTFAYTTYSDGKNGYYGFRLGYVVEKPITSKDEFSVQYSAIAHANSFKKAVKGKSGGLDELSVAQFYYGTTPKASVYRSGIIYSQDDFNPFVSNVTNQGTNEFKSTQTQHVSHYSAPVTTIGSANYDSCIDPGFLHDFKHLRKDVFFRKYWSVYYQNYELSLSTPLLPDPSGMFSRYPDDYVCVRHKRIGKQMLKWVDGEKRRKKLYISGHIMRHNLPDLSIENLLFNLALERRWYYEKSDGVISDDVLIRDAVNAFTKSIALEPSEHPAFSVNKQFWTERGITPNKAKWIVPRHLKARKVEQLFNPSLTREENLRILKENGITEKMLNKMVSEGDIMIDIAERIREHAYLSCRSEADTIRILELIRENEKITREEIAKVLGVSIATVNRRIKDMKGKMLNREGNNRSGRWIILPAFHDRTDSDSTVTTEDRSVQAEMVDSAFESVRPLVAFVDGNLGNTYEQTLSDESIGHRICGSSRSFTSAMDYFGHNNSENENKSHNCT